MTYYDDARKYREERKEKARRMCDPQSSAKMERIDATSVKLPPPIRNDYERVGRADGGRTGVKEIDERLGLVKPKALNFAQNVVTPGLKCGGRTKRKDGGAVVNVIVKSKDGLAASGSGGNMPPPGALPMPPVPPVMPPMPMPPMGAGAPGPMPLPRKTGGRVFKSYKDMTAGSASGEGRLQKAEIQSRKGKTRA